MSEAAPAATTDEMDGESSKEDEPESAAVPNSPGEKGTRAKSGQSETPTTGGRVQSRRGLILAEKVLDADAPASVQAVNIARKIKANAMLNTSLDARHASCGPCRCPRTAACSPH